MIPQSFIQDLLARIDIVDVVGRHVALKKAGANFLGLCPFHGEKTASFTVSPAKQFYHCFGCGAHGTAIGFLMEHGGLGYVDAIGELAQSIGVAVPQEAGPGGQADRRAPALLELLAQAAKFYRRRLKEAPQAIEYLKKRGLAGEIAARFGIGYAPDQWRGLEAAVADYEIDEMVAAGLVIEADGEGGRRKRYDRFRDRIMFPIRNPRGQVIGFGGRVLDRGEPKYLNSPETPVFSKGRELYGLYEARDAIRAEDCVIVVEGYMDAVMLAQHGVANAVATLGTATTGEHLRKLLRLVDRVVFAFDGDAAGRKAAWRALEAALAQASDTRRIDFLFLPPEHDPDSFVRERGAAGFREALADALPLSELLLRGLAERVDLATPEGRARLLAEARPLLQTLAAQALRMQLVHRLAGLAELDATEVARYLGPVTAAAHGDSAESRARATGATRSASATDTPDEAGSAGAGRPWHGAVRGQGSRGGWRERARFVPRVPVGKPDLEARIRLLTALHPVLAGGARGEWMPGPLAVWLDTVAALPAGSAFASVCEALRQTSPEAVARLERGVASDASAAAALSLDEARVEVEAALAQLRERHLSRLIDELVAGGMASPEERQRYQSLMAMRRRT
ncbi:MAG: DNA primase [Burkholderiaceae bacterium]|nr:DNA primase [Burkholderiaceae bacterium]MEB2349945.1 DNA primase [Burkholderiaceae bacterium]